MAYTPKTFHTIHIYFTVNEEAYRWILNSSLFWLSNHPNIWWYIFYIGCPGYVDIVGKPLYQYRGTEIEVFCLYYQNRVTPRTRVRSPFSAYWKSSNSSIAHCCGTKVHPHTDFYVRPEEGVVWRAPNDYPTGKENAEEHTDLLPLSVTYFCWYRRKTYIPVPRYWHKGFPYVSTGYSK